MEGRSASARRLDAYEIYRTQSARYDRLVAAEDCHGNLSETLHRIQDWRGRSVVEAGAGTGRVTAIYARDARRILCMDREAHMLRAARERLFAHLGKVSLAVADNGALCAAPSSADVFVEGWSWGHAVVDGPGTVEAVAARLFENARRVLSPAGVVILVETLGTNVDLPFPPDPRLARFFRILVDDYHLEQEVIRTDYRFGSAAEAAEVLGSFFGDSMRRAVQERGCSLVPEWTGVWHGRPADAPAGGVS